MNISTKLVFIATLFLGTNAFAYGGAMDSHGHYVMTFPRDWNDPDTGNVGDRVRTWDSNPQDVKFEEVSKALCHDLSTEQHFIKIWRNASEEVRSQVKESKGPSMVVCALETPWALRQLNNIGMLTAENAAGALRKMLENAKINTRQSPFICQEHFLATFVLVFPDQVPTLKSAIDEAARIRMSQHRNRYNEYNALMKMEANNCRENLLDVLYSTDPELESMVPAYMKDAINQVRSARASARPLQGTNALR